MPAEDAKEAPAEVVQEAPAEVVQDETELKPALWDQMLAAERLQALHWRKGQAWTNGGCWNPDLQVRRQYASRERVP